MDENHQLTLVTDVSNRPCDAVLLPPKLESIESKTNKIAAACDADPYWCTKADLVVGEGRRLTAYMSTSKQRPRKATAMTREDNDGP